MQGLASETSTTPLSEGLTAALNPIGTAKGLPNALYADPAALTREKKDVFGRNWSGIAFESDVPKNGDVVPLEFLGEPLILARDLEGSIRLYQNACRHRGVKLVEKPHNTTGLIRCPYHAWCYSLKGQLKQTPHAGGPGIHEHPGIDKSRLGLVEIRTHVWLGVVFANLDGQAPPFEVAHAGLLKRWSEFNAPLFHRVEDSSFSLDLQANWKLAIENYCESYHLPFIHPGLNAYSRLEDHENILGDGDWSGQLSKVYAPQLDEQGRAFERFEGLSPRWESNAEYVALYPNVMLGVHKDHTFAILVEPLAHDKIRERVAIYYAAEAMVSDEWQALRKRNAALWKDVFVEDIGVVEGMQKGRSASAFDGGRFSPVMDEATHHFHRWLAAGLLR